MSKRCHTGVLKMTAACMSSWLHSPRTLFAIVFIVTLSLSEVDIAQTNFASQSVMLSWGETLFYYFSRGINTMMSSSLFLIMADEVPRRFTFQTYALMRTTRVKWLTAQILMCVLLVVIMLALSGGTILLASLGRTAPGGQWSDVALIEQGFLMEDQDGVVSAVIRNNFTPFQATLYAIAPLALFWFSMLLIILLFGLYGRGVLGLTLCMISLFASWIIMTLLWPMLPLPIYYATLNNIIANWGVDQLVPTLVGYGVVDGILIALMFLRVKSAELKF